MRVSQTVCLSVCIPNAHISRTTHPNVTKSCTCMLPVTVARSASGSAVITCMLCTSGFVHDASCFHAAASHYTAAALLRHCVWLINHHSHCMTFVASCPRRRGGGGLKEQTNLSCKRCLGEVCDALCFIALLILISWLQFWSIPLIRERERSTKDTKLSNNLRLPYSTEENISEWQKFYAHADER